jgi:5-methylthioadenosine/S-adenosylhomocysteine deaminase
MRRGLDHPRRHSIRQNRMKFCLMRRGFKNLLTPGKDADIVLLKADRLNVWPLNNAPGAVVNLMNPSNVDTVFIAGKARKWRGNLVGVDVARVLRLVAEARDGVVRRSGFTVDLLG